MGPAFAMAAGYALYISIGTKIPSLPEIECDGEEIQLSYTTRSGENDGQGGLGDH
jgi:hypothetical protein